MGTRRRQAAASFGALLLTWAAANVAAEPPKPSDPVQVIRLTQLTNAAPFFMRPVWSPDGQWLAFGCEGTAGIEIIRPDGSGRRTLTQDPGSGYKFAWSPDSSRIAYRASLRADYDALYVIKSVDAASGESTALEQRSPEILPPAWSASNANQCVSFLVGTTRSNTPWRGCRAKRAPAPTPNGGVLLYTDDLQVWSCAFDGTRRQLTAEGGMEPLWSPDRSRIVYSQMGLLVTIAPDGSKRRALTRGHNPSWSPDGRRLAYDVTTDDGHQVLTSEVWVINADGTNPTRLTNTPDLLEGEPAWSPDGKCIACRLADSGRVLMLWLE